MNPSPVSIPDTEVHPLRSAQVGDDFELWIARPRPGFVPSPEPPRLLVVLDANLCFGTAVEMTRLMHQLYGELPPILVVGIAYPGSDFARQGMLRARDFTPTADTGMASMSASLPRPSDPVAPAMGGAPAFLRFLADDVLPFVSARFEHAERGRTLFGSSLGGLFATWALLTEPETFDAWVAVSPALWWDEGVVMNAPVPRPVGSEAPRVWLGAGSLEEAPHIPMLARFRLISNARDMARRLVDGGFPAETTTFEEIAGETHTSVIPAALTRGLRAAHPRTAPPR